MNHITNYYEELGFSADWSINEIDSFLDSKIKLAGTSSTNTRNATLAQEAQKFFKDAASKSNYDRELAESQKVYNPDAERKEKFYNFYQQSKEQFSENEFEGAKNSLETALSFGDFESENYDFFDFAFNVYYKYKDYDKAYSYATEKEITFDIHNFRGYYNQGIALEGMRSGNSYSRADKSNEKIIQVLQKSLQLTKRDYDKGLILNELASFYYNFMALPSDIEPVGAENFYSASESFYLEAEKYAKEAVNTEFPSDVSKAIIAALEKKRAKYAENKLNRKKRELETQNKREEKELQDQIERENREKKQRADNEKQAHITAIKKSENDTYRSQIRELEQEIRNKQSSIKGNHNLLFIGGTDTGSAIGFVLLGAFFMGTIGWIVAVPLYSVTYLISEILGGGQNRVNWLEDGSGGFSGRVYMNFYIFCWVIFAIIAVINFFLAISNVDVESAQAIIEENQDKIYELNRKISNNGNL